MKVRSIVAALATAVACGGFLTAAAVPAHAGSACPSADPLATSVSGSVTPADPQHWWTYTTATPKLVTMVPTVGDPDLKIVSADCGTVVCYPYTVGSEVCAIPAGSYNVGVLYYSSPTSSADYTISVASPECSDGVDNDRDGKTDFPADQGCTDAGDTSEGVACNTRSGATICAGISPGAVRQEVRAYSLTLEPTAEHRVVGYARTYRVMVANTAVNVPCVDLVVDGGEESACRDAGGTQLDPGFPLVDQRVNEYEPKLVAATVARICYAELQATVNGAGIASAPAYTLC